ncbi:DUF4097 family beta strand repeat protein [Lactobacillus kitasatonis]|uniref:DUF4097 family beta strand repeat protein n=1 Tax=Lactobacillus kitasatonis TaxID=237446 RepID=A0ABS1LTD5_9LACO|nr:DUF4097 family beta strand repeat protein [Lactobacillus kitasatonis]
MRKMLILIFIVVIAIGGVYFLYNSNDIKTVNKNFSVESFNQIKVDNSIDNIRLVTGDRYSVSYTGQEKLEPSVKVKNGILTIDSPERSITINGSIFNAKKLKQELTIKMPKKELKYLSIDTSNGNILADNLEVQKGTIDTSNGTVKVGKTNVEGYDLSTSNGHITVEGENKSDEFEKNTDAKNVLSIDTSNGNISVN